MDSLIAIDGPYTGTTFPLGASQIIGRVTGNEIALPDDEGASRRHARITRRGDSFSIVDLNSSNGTIVNGARVPRAELHDGDVVVIGTTRFRVEIASYRPSAQAQAGAAKRTVSFDDRVSVRDSSAASTRHLRSLASQEETRGGLGRLDISQMGGFPKFLVMALGVALMLGLGYFFYWLTSGGR